MRKIIICLLITSILLLSAGCGSAAEDGDPVPAANTTIPIFNRDHQEIGQISCFRYSILTDQGILYTKIPKGTASADPKKLEYHLYDIGSGKDHTLATIRDWYYEASHEAIEKDGHLYLSVSTGKYGERKNSTQTIYDIDLQKYEMTPLLQIEGGIPYNSYTIIGDELILAELLDSGDTDLIRVDLKNKPKKPIFHKYDEKNVFVPDSIRHVFSDGENLYMLRLDWDDRENYSLYLDTYDPELNRTGTLDITDTCVAAVNENNQAEIQNECRQFVGEFFVKDQFFFYQNFSITNFLGRLTDQKLERFAETDDLFTYVTCADPKAPLLFCRIFGDDSDDRTRRNLFYLVDPDTAVIKTAEFYSDNSLCTFRSATRSPQGKILLTMAYDPWEDEEPVPERLYFLDQGDLEFK